MDEVVLIDLKIDQVTNDKALESILGKQQKLIENTKALTDEQKKLKAQGETNSKQYIDNAKQIELNKKALKNNKQEVSALTKALETESNSINAIVARNKELVKSRNNVDTSTEEGKKKLKAINDELDKNNEAIKANVSSLEKQKIGVGDYTGALDKLVPGLGATAQGFIATTKAMAAMALSPVGFILITLGTILAVVTKYLTGTARGQDEMNKIMAIGGAVIGKLSDALIYLVEHGLKFLADAWSAQIKFLEFIIPGFKELVDLISNELNEAISDPIALANLKNRNDILERELILLKASSEARIAELKLKAEDKSLDIVTRQDALKEALQLQQDLTAKQTEFAENKLKISQLEHSQSESNKDDLKEEAELEAELGRIRKEGSDRQTELFTKEQALRLEINAKVQEANDELRARERAASETQAAELIKIEDLHAQQVIKLNTKLETNVEKIRTQFAKRDVESRKKQLEFNKQLMSDEAEAQLQTLGAISSALGVFRGKNKVAAAGEALINTFLGVTRILSAPAEPFIEPFASITRAIQIAATLASGYNAIANINKAKFAEGGRVKAFEIGGRDHAQGGTKFYGEDGTAFEAQKGESLFVLKREAHRSLINDLSRRNTRFGGVSWTDQQPVAYAAQGGQIAINQSQTPQQNGIDIEQTLDAFSKKPIVVLIDEVADGLSKRAQVLDLVTPIE